MVLQMTMYAFKNMEMVSSLVKSNIEFDFFAYPNKNHRFMVDTQDFICIIK